MAPYTTAHKHDVDQSPALNIVVGSRVSWCKCWVCSEKEKGEPLLTYLARYAIRADRPAVLQAFEDAEEAETEASPIPGFVFGKEETTEPEKDYTATYEKLNGQPDAVFMSQKGIDQNVFKNINNSIILRAIDASIIYLMYEYHKKSAFDPEEIKSALLNLFLNGLIK